MPNGTKGDHPLTDILCHKIEVYGKEADDLIHKISELSSQRELYEWWDKEIGWSNNRDLALQKARNQYAVLLKRAHENGWESQK
jgi:hypothetical protein